MKYTKQGLMRLLTGFLLVPFFYSCASYENKQVRKNAVQLHESEINRFNGTYELYPDIDYDHKDNTKSSGKWASKLHLPSAIDNRSTVYDSLKQYTVRLNVLDKNTMLFIVHDQQTPIDTILLKGKLKRNGLFYFKNLEVKSHGVPYLFGGTQSNKSRIGLTADNGLLVNQANDNSGAVLLIFWAGNAYNSTLHYKRIE